MCSADRLVELVRQQIASQTHPCTSPFRAQMMPHFTAADEREIAKLYAQSMLPKVHRACAVSIRFLFGSVDVGRSDPMKV